MNKTIIIAHRGHGPTSLMSGNGGTVPEGICPENTLKSFREAVRQGADGIEFDVFATKDHEIVVIHDDELNKNVEGANRTGTELGNVSEKTLAELSPYNVGQDERIPSLRETFDFFVAANAERAAQGKQPLFINLELKGDGTHRGVAALVHEYAEKGLLRVEDFIFCSFKHDQIAAIKKENPSFRISPSIKTASLFGDNNMLMPGWNVKEGAAYDPEGLEKLRRFHRENKCAALDPVLWDIYRPLVEMAKEEGLALHISTSDLRTFEREHLVVLLAIERSGVPLSFKTDEPAQARRILDELRETFEQGMDARIHSVMKMETVDNLRRPSSMAMRNNFIAAGKEQVDPLAKPIAKRPRPYSNSYASEPGHSTLSA